MRLRRSIRSIALELAKLLIPQGPPTASTSPVELAPAPTIRSSSWLRYATSLPVSTLTMLNPRLRSRYNRSEPKKPASCTSFELTPKGRLWRSVVEFQSSVWPATTAKTAPDGPKRTRGCPWKSRSASFRTEFVSFDQTRTAPPADPIASRLPVGPKAKLELLFRSSNGAVIGASALRFRTSTLPDSVPTASIVASLSRATAVGFPRGTAWRNASLLVLSSQTTA